MIQRIGNHAVTNASVMDTAIDKMLAGEKVKILYSDPPWGDSYLKMFQTHTFKATGHRPEQPTYLQLCNRYADLIQKHVTDWVFIETSVSGSAPMLNAIKPYVSEHKIYDTVYGSDLPAILIVARISNGPFPDLSISGMKGLPFVKAVLSTVATPDAIVLDPCCGAGYTARAAMFHNMRFRGNELNPARLAKTIKYLEAA